MCKDSYGFALNRFFVPYTNEASRIFEEGLGSPAQINRITEKSMGVAAGPFVVMNLVGMQTMANAAENLEPLGDFYKPTNIVKEMGATKGKWNLGEDNALNEEIASQIIGRLWGAIFLPILQELDEEVASPSEIDMGAGLALRFGTPPCAAMDKFGQAKVKNLIAYHCNRYGVTKPKCLDRVGFLLE